MRLIACAVLTLLMVAPCAFAQSVFSLGPGGRTIAGPGRERAICRNTPRAFGNNFIVMETMEGNRMLCVTVANEGTCTLDFNFRSVNRREGCNDAFDSHCTLEVTSVPSHAVRSLCDRTGGWGMRLEIIVGCPDLAPDALGPCPFSWRVDAVG